MSLISEMTGSLLLLLQAIAIDGMILFVALKIVLKACSIEDADESDANRGCRVC